MEYNLPCKPTQQRPTAADTLYWLKWRVWSLPVLDDRSAKEILGYGDDGLCR
jgi:hypothetical protein